MIGGQRGRRSIKREHINAAREKHVALVRKR